MSLSVNTLLERLMLPPYNSELQENGFLHLKMWTALNLSKIAFLKPWFHDFKAK